MTANNRVSRHAPTVDLAAVKYIRIVIASYILVALQQIVSRHAEASTPTVLSFGKVIADGAITAVLNIDGTWNSGGF